MSAPRIGRDLAVCPRCGLGMGALLTFAEAAACLRVGKGTVRYWAYNERRFKVTKVGRAARVLHADFDVMVQRPGEPSRSGLRVSRAVAS